MLLKKYLLNYWVLLIFLCSCGLTEPASQFTFEKNDQGVELLENWQPVFFYQEQPKSLDGKYVCTNYLHPLYSLTGDTLTEEFPPDHPYHRGIFWAWHQIYINGDSVGDGWVMENIRQKVTNVQTSVENQLAKLKSNILWSSLMYENSKPYLDENATITVHPLENNIRKIDFEISLKALVPGVEIGGANDEKGYGGLCARLKLPKDLTFTSVDGPVTPQLTQIKAGPWMDFSASFGRNGETSGISILCSPKTLNYPEPWILRSETSMQNIVFPGRNRVKIPMDKPIILYYRIIVHNGNAASIDLDKLQSEYEKNGILNLNRKQQ